MDYLERNELLIAEIGMGLRLQRGGFVGKGSMAKFTSVGSYESALLGSPLYVGLKENPKNREGI